jgi:cytochrome c6
MNCSVIRIGQKLCLACALIFIVGASARADDSASLFKTKCAACHGADGSANTSMGKSLKIRDLGSAEVQKQTDAQLTEIISDGKSPMPAYKGKLTEEQIKGLVAYIRSLKK